MPAWLAAIRLTDIIDLVLVLTLAEFVALAVYRSRTGKGPQVADMAANLLAGLCLMLALRAAAAQAPIVWAAIFIAAAGAAHAVDLRRRWPR